MCACMHVHHRKTLASKDSHLDYASSIFSYKIQSDSSAGSSLAYMVRVENLKKGRKGRRSDDSASGETGLYGSIQRVHGQQKHLQVLLYMVKWNRVITATQLSSQLQTFLPYNSKLVNFNSSLLYFKNKRKRFSTNLRRL